MHTTVLNLPRLARACRGAWQMDDAGGAHMLIEPFLDAAVLSRAMAAFPGPDEGPVWESAEQQSPDGKLQSHRKLVSCDQRNFPLPLQELIAALHGESFIRVIEDATGIHGLIPDDSLYGGGLDHYRSGAFLGIHVDANVHPVQGLHRRLNLILFCIDAENNDFDPARGDPTPWTNLEACVDHLGAYRQRLEQATGTSVALTWAVRADPQVGAIYGDLDWGLRTYASKWRELASKGDDIGLHPHPQRWSEVEQGWCGGQDDPTWIEQVIRDSFEAYRKVLGRAPQTFRFGNRFMSQDIANVIERLGMRFDLTLEPGYSGRDGSLAWHRVPGPCPDYFDVPRVPYRAVAGNYREPDAERVAGIWHIPMSTAPIGSAAPLSHGPHYLAVAPSLFPYEVLHLRLSPELFRRAVDHLLHESPRPYLSVVIRCDMIHLPEVWANLETLRTHPMAGRFVFSRADQLLRHLGHEVA